MSSNIYLLIHHEKGIDWASGYGKEYIEGYATSLKEAKEWVAGLKENGFERRLYRKIDRRGVYKGRG